MKKEAQLAVLVLVMVAGLYTFDYTGSKLSGLQTGITGAAAYDYNSCYQYDYAAACFYRDYAYDGNCYENDGCYAYYYADGCYYYDYDCAKKATGAATASTGSTVAPASTATTTKEAAITPEKATAATTSTQTTATPTSTAATTTTASTTSTTASTAATTTKEAAATPPAGSSTTNPTIASFTASPATIKQGEQATLMWTGIENANLCYALIDKIGMFMIIKKIEGSELSKGTTTVTPKETTEYQIKCYREKTKDYLKISSKTVTVTTATPASAAATTTTASTTSTTASTAATAKKEPGKDSDYCFYFPDKCEKETTKQPTSATETLPAGSAATPASAAATASQGTQTKPAQQPTAALQTTGTKNEETKILVEKLYCTFFPNSEDCKETKKEEAKTATPASTAATASQGTQTKPAQQPTAAQQTAETKTLVEKLYCTFFPNTEECKETKKEETKTAAPAGAGKDISGTGEAATGTMVTINLAEGANMISLPVTPASKKTADVLSSIKDELYDVSYWVDGQQKSWLAAEELTPGKGYKVHMKKAATLKLKGAPYEFQPISLNANEYQLIGASFSEVKLKDVLGSCKLDKLTLSSLKENVDTPITVDSGTELQPGKGYFIKSSEACRLEKKPEPTGKPEIGSFTANPATINKGQEVTLAWKGVKNSDLCDVLDKDGNIVKKIFGAEIPEGSAKVTPQETAEYRLNCIRIKDMSTYSKSVTINVVVITIGAVAPGAAVSVEINLAEGNNFISLPVTPASKKTADVLSSIKDDLGVVFYFDAARGGWPLAKELTPGKGYNVQMKKAATLQIKGMPYEFQPISLNADEYQLIGTQLSEIKLKDVLGSCKLDKLKMWSKHSGYSLKDPIAMNSDTALQPGKGYFIISSEKCTLEKKA